MDAERFGLKKRQKDKKAIQTKYQGRHSTKMYY